MLPVFKHHKLIPQTSVDFRLVCHNAFLLFPPTHSETNFLDHILSQ